MQILRKCQLETCGREFLCPRHKVAKGRGKFCSLSCSRKFNAVGPRNSWWKGGRVYSTDGYIWTMCPDHPKATKKGYVYEHRLVMEKAIGRYLSSDEVVHHIDGVKDNNSLQNLALTNFSQHSRHHCEGRPRPVRVLQCAYCGINFEKSERNIRAGLKSGTKRFFCSKRCVGKSVH